MQSGEREGSFAVVDRCSLPTGGIVTGPAVRSELSIVFVPGCMTGETIRRRAFENAVYMAGRAGGIFMQTHQRESCFVMVEGCVFPAGRSVAGRAVCTELPVMSIILFMAGDAIFRGPFKHSVDMT
jgi:hypothetical protein